MGGSCLHSFLVAPSQSAADMPHGMDCPYPIRMFAILKMICDPSVQNQSHVSENIN